MATAILERERNTERDLRAYGKLSGREETREMTEGEFSARLEQVFSDLENKARGIHCAARLCVVAFRVRKKELLLRAR